MSPEKPSVIVVGAGMGGLSCAIRLAAQGFRVTVLEAAGAPGGKMRTAPSGAGPVSAGPTVLTMRSVFADLFAAAGARLEDHVTLIREPILARHFWEDGSVLDLHDDPGRNVEAIYGFAGSRAAREFERFSARAGTLFEGFEGPVMAAARPSLPGLAVHVARRPELLRQMAPFSSLSQLLRTSFSDPRLRQLFGRYATYVGGMPGEVPALLSLIWASEARGVWRVEGGMQCLAEAMAGLAERLGAEFRYGTPVARIERQGGRAAGVVTGDGTRLMSDAVLFNGDPNALREGLLGEALRGAVDRRGTVPRSLSAYVWAFAATAEGVELSHHNVFFGSVPEAEFADLAAGRMPADPNLYVCAQDRGAGAEAPPVERFEIIMNGPAGQPAPEKEFATCRARTFDRLAAMGLRFSPIPGRAALTTPEDFAARFPGSDGSLYGRSPRGTMAAFHRPVARTAIWGLYLAGGGAHPGAGIPMACLSGRHAAAAIMQDLASTSTFPRTATRGGISTASPTTAGARSPSSAS